MIKIGHNSRSRNFAVVGTRTLLPEPRAKKRSIVPWMIFAKVSKSCDTTKTPSFVRLNELIPFGRPANRRLHYLTEHKAIAITLTKCECNDQLILPSFELFYFWAWLNTPPWVFLNAPRGLLNTPR